MSTNNPMKNREKTKVNYDRLSRWYDLLADSSEKPYRIVGLQKLNLKEGEIVLEIGFGTGHAIQELAHSVGNSGKVYGIDISKGMINITEARVKKAGLTERVELKFGDATELPFPNDFFSAIFMSFTLELFEPSEIKLVLLESWRVLRDGGRICVVALSRNAKVNLMTRLYDWAHSQFPIYIDCKPIFVKDNVTNAGFHIVNVADRSMWGLPIQIVLAEKS
jgi:ubiquinone/menaquinone biosynthesis C-methylase UbiE